ncbi:uncharacterized protein LOC113367140 [Ctenocephalides felis]|uniref:uncharacterized protein LOC113367140 n=1 Tax=Ctenocephalides felis TaxID=7515 RepID=UPI000E6E3D4B|nr:uncharacterized protein LOC113367140 [Ctenocephalides felis]
MIQNEKSYLTHKSQKAHKERLISYFGCKNKGLFFKDLVCQECGLIIFSNDEGALPKHTPITFKFNDTSVNTNTKIDGKEIMFAAMNELHGNASHMNGGCLGVREDNFYDNEVLDTITKYYVNDGMDIGCVPAFSNEKIAVPLMNDFVEEYEHGQLDNLKIIENNGVEANNGNDTKNINVTNSKEETRKLEEIFLKFWDDFDLSDKNLSLNKQIFGIIDKGFLKCLLCRHKLTLNKRGVLGHINGMSHRRNLSEFLEIRHYCSVCRLFIQDFNLHKISSNHISNIPDYNDDFNKDNPPTMKHECSECRVISYYPAGTNFEHTHFEFEFSKVITKGKISSNAKIRKKILTLIEDEQVLDDYSVNLIKLAKTAAQSNELILATCTMLEKNLSMFTSCKAYPFGSRMTGLGCESSDLDIFFDSGSMYNGLQNQNSQFQNSLIDVCCEVLKKCDEWDFVFPVTKARTPIIKAFNTVYKMDCDISFRNGLGVENTVILKRILNDQPIAKRMILILKHWLKLIKVSMNGYAIAYLVIFYLQLQKLIVPVWRMTTGRIHEKKKICGWECQVVDYVAFPKSTEKLSNLLRGFFKYYGEFNYSQNVICPLLGQIVNKEEFEDYMSLPEQFKPYIDHCQRISRAALNDFNSNDMDSNDLNSNDMELLDQLYFGPLKTDASMCLQDPVDLSHNVTKGIRPTDLEKFKIMCEFSSSIIATKNSSDRADNYIDE